MELVIREKQIFPNQLKPTDHRMNSVCVCFCLVYRVFFSLSTSQLVDILKTNSGGFSNLFTF